MLYRIIFVLCLIAAMKVEAQQPATPLLNQGFGVTNSILRTQEIETELAMKRLQRQMESMQQQSDSTERSMNNSFDALSRPYSNSIDVIRQKRYY